MFDYAEKLSSKLPEADALKLRGVFQELLQPQACWEKYCQGNPDGKLCERGEQEEEDEVEVPAGPLADVKASFNKTAGVLLDLLLQVVTCQYLSDCQQLATEPGGLYKALQAAEEKAASQEGDDGSSLPELVKHLRLLTMQFDGQGKSVSVTGGNSAPQQSLLSTLTTEGTEGEGAERERLWKHLVQMERKKFIGFSVPRAWTKDALLSCFRGSGKTFAHTGSLNSSHRMFTAAADLLHEESAAGEPWMSGPHAPPEKLWKEIMGFVASMSGPNDFGFLFDGRMRSVRRWNDARSAHECVLISHY